jgi:hypothetical protein
MNRPSPRRWLTLAAAAVLGCGAMASVSRAGFPFVPPPTGISPEPPIIVPPPPPPPPPPAPPPPSAPEPGTLVLGLIGAGMAGWACRRKRREVTAEC